MNCKELRIGNITNKGTIKNFYESGIHIGLGKCYGFNELDPIELTEEWLLKFGYEKITGLDRWFISHQGRWHYIYKDNGKWWYIFNIEGKDIRINQAGIKSVCQLQNLFFVLTREELKLI